MTAYPSLTHLFKALSDETRLRMMALLVRNRELCVCEFVEALGITQSKASRHLRHLVAAGLLADRKAGTWVYYRIKETPDAAQKRILEVLASLLPIDDVPATPTPHCAPPTRGFEQTAPFQKGDRQ